VLSLSVASGLKGVYCGVLAVADEVFRDVYVLYEREWTGSLTCAAAGVLFLLSTHVTSLTIVTEMINTSLAQTRYKRGAFLGRRGMIITCGITWVLGLALAVVPLLPVATHGQAYQTSGVCVPLVGHSAGRLTPFVSHYTLGVRCALSFVVLGSVCVSLGLHSVGRNTQNRNKLVLPGTKPRSSSSIPGDVIAVHCLCWMTFVTTSLTAIWGDVTVDNDLVAVATLLVPQIPAALFPAMMFASHARDERRKKIQGRLRKLLLTRKCARHGAL
jgi:hypothetical protein